MTGHCICRNTSGAFTNGSNIFVLIPAIFFALIPTPTEVSTTIEALAPTQTLAPAQIPT